MQHYSELIIEFGNLIFSSTLWYERVHQKVQRSIEGSRNKRNVAFSIANAFFFDPEIGFKKEKIDKHLIKKFNSLNEIDEQFKDQLERFGVSNNAVVYEVKQIKIDNQKFIKNRYYLYRYKHDNMVYPIFIKLIKIYLVEEEAFMFALTYKGINFDKKSLSYEIQPINDLIKININDLDYYKELLAFTSNSKLRILKDFHIPFEISNLYLNCLNEEELESEDLLNMHTNFRSNN